MSRDQRTRLNVMISEQTGAARPGTPGRSTLAEHEAAESEAEQHAEAPMTDTRPRSIFDLPFANERAAAQDREQDHDGDAEADDDGPVTGSRRG